MSVMERMGRLRMLRSAVSDRLKFLARQILSRSRLVYIIFLGLAALLLLFSASQAPPAQAWLRGFGYGKGKLDYEKIRNMRKNLTAEWEIQPKLEDQNWAGLQKMRKERADGNPTGSMWWDERAEQYFISKLEESQFPANCSEAHWIACFDWLSGLFSSVHIFSLPLFFSMVRGHTLVSIATPKHPAFLGCGPDKADRNMQCFFNVTNCIAREDSSKNSKILATTDDSQRTTWDEMLLEDDDFFAPGGLTVLRTTKWPPWDTAHEVPSSSFASFVEAHNYYKLTTWLAMGRAGKVGAIASDAKANSTSNLKTCGEAWDLRMRRVDMVMVSLMSSWMLNRIHDSVKRVADEIISLYTDPSGQPLWKTPVLAIHIRQTDKKVEDPYWRDHNGTYRPVEDYAMHIERMEKEYGFRFPTVFLLSDNGTTLESLAALLSGSDSETAPEANKERYIMYDWIEDEHLLEKYKNHRRVPSRLKYDMTTHFLASLYIVQKIADHAIVTYSSNVGRFLGEIMAAKHRMASVDCEGPLVTSLDTAWWWH